MPSKGTTNQRGYDYRHQRLRKQFEPLVRSGRAVCWRCGLPIKPDAKWDLGHDDNDRTKYRGPEHVGRECPAGGNRGTAGRGRGQATTATGGVDTTRQW
ncbi:hypothetical protein MSP7336_01812 [Mycobacterium shimoidei]|uniref:Uncharacterized protein n=1 Tax=Mycobacterium shimoidei TaxID=29313 RepID=A0A375YXD4_MYCSH|nr:hypothetical protein [Mycobacterium shimoidei]SRX93573.1 hypothetical protein MSP7336_01812 [Mycobacterium shimoidei]